MKLIDKILRFDYTIPLTQHKFLEWQFCFFHKTKNFTQDRPIELSFKYTRQTDHAGCRFVFGLHKLIWFEISIYDHRHWNHQLNTWATREEDSD